ncbi:MAG: RNA methyltransferase [Chryseotalea sp. WA131a]|jgi:TrmH family RNA methyltransferase|nr:MAG: RNA methyltransferase [Chryseotalea sp. WA131a]
MISKATGKFIKSLQVKKYRKEEQSFIVEGAKSVAELLRSDFEVKWLAATDDFLQLHSNVLSNRHIEWTEASAKELGQLGTFQTNDGALAIASMKPNQPLTVQNEYALILDDIRDPGNLGTIIRTADWYGIDKIIASEKTADFYNPKVISATMGSFCRVQLYYANLVEYLNTTHLPVYGTFLNGKNIYTVDFEKAGLIAMGNEANGISTEVGQLVTVPITIPKRGGAESLNASIATAIVLDNVFR